MGMIVRMIETVKGGFRDLRQGETYELTEYDHDGKELVEAGKAEAVDLPQKRKTRKAVIDGSDTSAQRVTTR